MFIVAISSMVSMFKSMFTEVMFALVISTIALLLPTDSTNMAYVRSCLSNTSTMP